MSAQGPKAGRGLQRLGGAALVYALLCLAYALVIDGAVSPELRAGILESAGQAIAAIPPDQIPPGGLAEAKESWIQAQLARYGLDKPFPERAFRRAVQLVVWDFGIARRTGTLTDSDNHSIGAIVAEALPWTLSFLVLGAALSLGLGVLLGLRSTSRPRGGLARFLKIAGPLSSGFPLWWLALVVLMLTFWNLPFVLFVPPAEAIRRPWWLQGIDLVLPVLTYAGLRMWACAQTASSVFMVYAQGDHVQAARARGLPEGLVRRGHILRPGLGTVMNLAGVQLVWALGGDILLEVVFNRPGLGSLIWTAIRYQEIGLASACLVVVSLVGCLAFAFLDLRYPGGVR